MKRSATGRNVHRSRVFVPPTRRRYRTDQGIVPRAARVHREHVSRSAVGTRWPIVSANPDRKIRESSVVAELAASRIPSGRHFMTAREFLTNVTIILTIMAIGALI